MEPIFGLLAAGTIGCVAYMIGWIVRRNRAELWRSAATRVGLQEISTTSTLGWETELRGVAGTLKVRLSSYSRGRYEHGTRITIDGLGHGPYELALRREGVATAFEKAFGETEIELGDQAFDGRVFVQGSPPLVLALFDAETRPLVSGLVNGRLPLPDGALLEPDLRTSLSNGELRVEVREGALHRAGKQIPEILEVVLAIARRLQRPSDIASRLAANLKREPLAAVRLTILKTLGADFREWPRTQEVLREACHDPDPGVRLHAAAQLAGEADDALLALAEDTSVAEPHAVGALSALTGRVTAKRATTILATAMEHGRQAVARAAIALAAAPGNEAARATLERLVVGADAWLAETAAAGLGTIGSPAAEPALAAALRHTSAVVRVAAARALGSCGTTTAVAPLREASSEHPLDGDLRRSARQAIAEIQSRVPGASPGQLSLADATAGQLSLADGSAGQLTLAAEHGAGDVELGSEDGGEKGAPPRRRELER